MGISKEVFAGLDKRTLILGKEIGFDCLCNLRLLSTDYYRSGIRHGVVDQRDKVSCIC
jgi:hypothetical protein